MSVGRRWKGWIPRFWRRQKQNLLVFSIYLALTLAYTYPVIFHLSTAIAGDGGDPIHPMWLIWWTKRAWFDLGTSPADLSVFYHPLAVRHPLLLTSPVIPLLAMPITVLAGPLVAHNLVFVASFALTSFAAYLLCSHLTRDRWAAFDAWAREPTQLR